MAITVRCRQCRKKISIDEAFAGGNCRCPYCKAITMVSGKAAAYRKTRTDRPDTPTSTVSQVQPATAKPVPLAKPVKIQGIVTLIFSGLLLLVIAAAILLVLYATMD